jgi:hypothetical protein
MLRQERLQTVTASHETSSRRLQLYFDRPIKNSRVFAIPSKHCSELTRTLCRCAESHSAKRTSRRAISKFPRMRQHLRHSMSCPAIRTYENWTCLIRFYKSSFCGDLPHVGSHARASDVAEHIACVCELARCYPILLHLLRNC